MKMVGAEQLGEEFGKLAIFLVIAYFGFKAGKKVWQKRRERLKEDKTKSQEEIKNAKRKS